MIGLTPRQRRLLDYLRHSPDASYDEMAVAIGARHKTTARCLILALEERGHIRRLPNRARAIEVLTPAQPTSYTARGQRFLFIPRMG